MFCVDSCIEVTATVGLAKQRLLADLHHRTVERSRTKAATWRILFLPLLPYPPLTFEATDWPLALGNPSRHSVLTETGELTQQTASSARSSTALCPGELVGVILMIGLTPPVGVTRSAS